MTTDDLNDMANSVLLKNKARDFQNNPLTHEETHALLDFCRKEICDGDKSNEHRQFYSRVFDILVLEIKKAYN